MGKYLFAARVLMLLFVVKNTSEGVAEGLSQGVSEATGQQACTGKRLVTDKS